MQTQHWMCHVELKHKTFLFLFLNVINLNKNDYPSYSTKSGGINRCGLRHFSKMFGSKSLEIICSFQFFFNEKSYRLQFKLLNFEDSLFPVFIFGMCGEWDLELGKKPQNSPSLKVFDLFLFISCVGAPSAEDNNCSAAERLVLFVGEAGGPNSERNRFELALTPSGCHLMAPRGENKRFVEIFHSFLPSCC